MLQGAEADDVGRAVVSYATSEGASARGQEATGTSLDAAFDIVAASAWPGVPPERVLIAPAQCRTLWRQFASDCSYAVQQVGLRQARLCFRESAGVGLSQCLWCPDGRPLRCTAR